MGYSKLCGHSFVIAKKYKKLLSIVRLLWYSWRRSLSCCNFYIKMTKIMLYFSCRGSSAIFLASWLSISLHSKNKCWSKHTYKMDRIRNNKYNSRGTFNSSTISCTELIKPKNIKFCIYLNFIKKNVQMKNAHAKIS